MNGAANGESDGRRGALGIPAEPLIKRQLQSVLVQRAFRHVNVSRRTDITMEFSFVGIRGRREEAIGSYLAFGGRVGINLGQHGSLDHL